MVDVAQARALGLQRHGSLIEMEQAFETHLDA
jgi:hypothetical protein